MSPQWQAVNIFYPIIEEEHNHLHPSDPHQPISDEQFVSIAISVMCNKPLRSQLHWLLLELGIGTEPCADDEVITEAAFWMPLTHPRSRGKRPFQRPRRRDAQKQSNSEQQEMAASGTQNPPQLNFRVVYQEKTLSELSPTKQEQVLQASALASETD